MLRASFSYYEYSTQLTFVTPPSLDSASRFLPVNSWDELRNIGQFALSPKEATNQRYLELESELHAAWSVYYASQTVEDVSSDRLFRTTRKHARETFDQYQAVLQDIKGRQWESQRQGRIQMRQSQIKDMATYDCSNPTFLLLHQTHPNVHYDPQVISLPSLLWHQTIHFLRPAYSSLLFYSSYVDFQLRDLTGFFGLSKHLFKRCSGRVGAMQWLVLWTAYQPTSEQQSITSAYDRSQNHM
jgi:hypothetical protein